MVLFQQVDFCPGVNIVLVLMLTLKLRLPDISSYTFLLFCAATGYIRDSARDLRLWKQTVIRS